MKAKRAIPIYYRWWVLLLLACVLFVAGLIGFKHYQEWSIDRELAALLAEMDKQQPLWRFEDWPQRRPTLKDEDNLSYQALNLPSKLKAELTNFERYFFDAQANPAHRMNAEQINELKTLLSASPKLADEIEQLLKLKSGTFLWSNPDEVTFKVMSLGTRQEIRSVANLIVFYIYQRIEENQPDAALRGCEALLHLAAAYEHEPVITGHLIRISIQNVAVLMLERTLAQTEPAPEALQRLQARCLAEADKSFALPGIEGDRAGIDKFLREVEQGRYEQEELAMFSMMLPFNRRQWSLETLLQQIRLWMGGSRYGYLPGERLKALRYYNQVLELVRKPDSNTLDQMTLLADTVGKNSKATQFFGAALRRIVESDFRRQINLRICAAELAAERARQSTGHMPAQWKDLVPGYLAQVPVDPFDGQPVRWKNTPTGFILYSVGPNRTDDGGAIRRIAEAPTMIDAGVEFYAKAHRRLAPRPAVLTEDDAPVALDDKEQFFVAARAGDVNKLKEVLERGVDINSKTEYGVTALCFAAEAGHLEAIQLLLDNKIDLHAKDTFYQADAMTWALMKDQADAVKLLLKAGAKGEASALASAIAQNKPKLLAAVLASGRIKQDTLNSTLTSLDAGKTELVKLLTDAGAKGKPKEATAETKKAETKTTNTAPSQTEEPAVPTKAVVESTERASTVLPWPGFRGHNNAGISDGQFPPTSWDASTGKHLAWKTPIPGLGLSCPVVWENKLFITTAVNAESPKPSLRIGQYGDVDSVKETAQHTWIVYCLDTDTGKILWQRVAHTGVPKVKRHMKSSHANATIACNGRYVVANFGSEGLFCYDMTGTLLWKQNLGKLGSAWFFNPDYEWGFGSSPIIYEDSVIVQCDVGKNSFIAAYTLDEGKEVWNTARDEIPSWCSPTVIYPENSRPELVTVATKYARGYDPLTGRELWKLGKFSEIAVPTPFYAEGLIYLTTGYRPIQPIFALKPGSKGDLTLPAGKEASESIAWSKSRGGPYLPTPLVYQGHLYVCNNAGVFSCYEAKTGKSVYQKRLGGKNGYTASLVAADGRIYCTDEEGVVRVVKAGPAFEILAINKLGEECLCHPAISHGHIFFRGREHVFAFALPAVKQ